MRKIHRWKAFICFSLLFLILLFSSCGAEKGLVIESKETTNFEKQESGDSTEVSGQEKQSVSVKSSESSQVGASTGTETVTIYICGAVMKEGVYELPLGSRVKDAVNAASGFTEDAAVRSVNLAKKLSDEERIYIPTMEEVDQALLPEVEDGSGGSDTFAREEKINLNTATKEALETLPGVGESKAEDIIAYRKEHGGFKSCEELMNIRGIKEGVYNKLKDLITVTP